MYEEQWWHRPILKVEDLVVSYYKKEILLGASLEVMPGEIVALVGTNGSGKSTLLKTIAGVVRSNSGAIIFDGIDITLKQPNELARLGIGFQMQGGVVFPSLTVTEHLQLAFQGRSASKNSHFDRIWNMFPKLESHRNKRAGLLSGGERQMLSFSMLLAQSSRLLLLDEPSGGLAPVAVKATMDFIRKLKNDEGITVLLAEQNLAEAARIADRAYVLRNGKTSVEENPIEILSNGKLEEIFFR